LIAAASEGCKSVYASAYSVFDKLYEMIAAARMKSTTVAKNVIFCPRLN